jgi:hypothetical protein
MASLASDWFAHCIKPEEFLPLLVPRSLMTSGIVAPYVSIALKRYAPHNIIHYYNAPPGFNDDDMKQAIETYGATIPDVIKLLGTKSGKNSSGLMQWANQSDANDAMCLCNHMKLEELSSSIIPGKRPNSYTLKLCFSSVPTIG